MPFLLSQVVSDPSPMLEWKEFGLAGLVIGCAFAFILYLHRDQKAERNEWRKSHITERADWRDSAKSRSEKTDKVISDFSAALKENTQAVQGIQK